MKCYPGGFTPVMRREVKTVIRRVKVVATRCVIMDRQGPLSCC